MLDLRIGDLTLVMEVLEPESGVLVTAELVLMTTLVRLLVLVITLGVTGVIYGLCYIFL